MNNEHILSANAYNPNIGGKEKEYRKPRETLREIRKSELEITAQVKKLQRVLK